MRGGLDQPRRDAPKLTAEIDASSRYFRSSLAILRTRFSPATESRFLGPSVLRWPWLAQRQLEVKGRTASP